MFDQRSLSALAARRDEPAWLRERRQASLAAFERFPMPTRQDEDYRRSDLRRLDLNAFAPDGAKPPKLKGADNKDVVFCTLAEAVERHPDLVRPYLEDGRVGADEDKWSALNGAFWTHGVFLYVPSGLEVTVPLQATWTHPGGNKATFTRTLVVADEWSNVTFIDDFASAASASADPGFNASVVDVVAKEGAAARYYHLQNWGTGVWNFSRERFFGKRDAALNLLQVALGSRFTKAYVHAHLDEPGVNAELLGLTFIGGKQHVDHSTLQNHIQGQTLSDLLFKCAMLEQARSVYGGLIAIRPNAQRSDAYQNNRNLLLSPTARADSIPMLEIMANDVRCTHGSTTSSVDEEEVFYLMSRGLPRAQAERMIVEGFFANVLEKIPLVPIRRRLEQAIDEKIARLRFG
ncbi:MAG TPA: Fe-S cluster assembly protein SufD [Chloroflexota bacterium]|jgi:Fe-S cluster assembly protein SufD|nr:Fe-S cluster assembly protein SufD [Chloroflexota bacterium]